jgi:hypothetical protein
MSVPIVESLRDGLVTILLSETLETELGSGL